MKDENIIRMNWKMNYVSSCVSTQSAGVIILYDNSYEYIKTYTDKGVLLALMLVLVKCYDNEMVKATPHLFHLIYSALCS